MPNVYDEILKGKSVIEALKNKEEKNFVSVSEFNDELVKNEFSKKVENVMELENRPSLFQRIINIFKPKREEKVAEIQLQPQPQLQAPQQPQERVSAEQPQKETEQPVKPTGNVFNFEVLNHQSIFNFVKDKLTIDAISEEKYKSLAPNKPETFEDFAQKTGERLPSQVRTITEGVGSFAGKFTTGMVASVAPFGIGEKLHNAVNPQTIMDKVAFYSGQALGAIAGIGGIESVISKPVLTITNPIIKKITASSVIKGLETKLPTISKIIFGKKRIEGFLQKTVLLAPSFGVYNQITMNLDAPAKERLNSFVRNLFDSAILSRLNLIKNPVASVSSMFAYGYGATRLSGGSKEDSLIQGAIFGGLGVLGLVTAPKVELENELVRKAVDEIKSAEKNVEEVKRLEDIKVKLTETKPQEISKDIEAKPEVVQVKESIFSLPKQIEEKVQVSNLEKLKQINPSKVIDFIEQTKTKDLSAFDEYIKEINLGKEAPQELWEKIKSAKEIEEVFGGRVQLDLSELETGYTVKKSKAKKASVKSTDAGGLFDRSDLINFLLDYDFSRNEEVAIQALKNYLPDKNKALNIIEQINDALFSGKPLDELKLEYKLSPEKRTNLEKVISKMVEFGGDERSLVGAINNINPLEIEPKKYGIYLIRANKFAREYNFRDVKDLLNTIKESSPDIFDDIERKYLAKDIVKQKIVDEIQYDFSKIRDLSKTEEEYINKNKIKAISRDNLEKEIKGRKEIWEEFVNRISIALGDKLYIKKGKLGKDILGRTYSDKLIELKSYDMATAFHEAGHIISNAINIIDNIPKEINKAVMDEIMPLVKNFEPNRQTPQEAFAEFITRYVLEGDTKDRFPITHDFFENFMGAKKPEALEALKIARESFNDLINSPELYAAKTEIYDITERSVFDNLKEQIKTGGLNSVLKYIKKKTKELYRNELNYFEYAKDLDDKLGIKDIKESIWFKFYKMEGRIGGLTEILLRRGMISDINKYFEIKDNNLVKDLLSGKSYYEIVSQIPTELYDDVSAYRIAKESIRRAELGQKVNPLYTPERALKIIQQVREKFPEVDRIADELQQYISNIRKLFYQSGIISEDVYNKLNENPIYAHLFRQGGLFDGDFETLSNLQNSIFKKSFGSSRPFVDPFVADILEVMVFAKRAVINDILKSIYNKVKNNPTGLARVSSPDTIPIKVSSDEVIRILKMFDSRLEYDKELVKEYKEILENNEEMLINIWRPSMNQGNKVKVFIDGKAHYLELDDTIINLLNINNEKVINSQIFNFISQYTKIKRALATTFSISFGIRNPIRDALTAYFMADKLFIPIVDTWNGLKSVLKQDDIYWEALRWGVGGGTIVSSDINEYVRNFNKYSGKSYGGLFDRMTDKLQTISENGELMTRLGVFRKYDIKNANELVKAVIDASEATFNWGQKGGPNSIVRLWNKIDSFFKPHFIVVDKQTRILGNKTFRTFVRGLPFVALSLYIADKYKDDEEYNNLPVWRRLLSLNFRIPKEVPVVGGKMGFIPIPDTFGILFISTPQLIYSQIQKKDKYLAQKFLKEAINQVNPLSAGDVIPDVFKPVIEDLFNVNLYTGGQLVPDYLKGLVPEKQYTSYTSHMAVGLSKALSELGISVSPIKIDNYLRGYLISVADLSRSIVDGTLSVLGIKPNELKKEFELTDIIGINALVRNLYEPSSLYQVSKLTDRYKNVKSVYDTFNSLRKIEPQKAVEFYKKHEKELMLYPTINAQYEAIRNYIALYRTIQKSKINDDVKQAKLKSLRRLILHYSQLYNDIMETNYEL